MACLKEPQVFHAGYVSQGILAEGSVGIELGCQDMGCILLTKKSRWQLLHS